MKNKTIAIIGCGNLGTSIVNGLLSQGVKPSRITATRRNVHLLEHLKSTGINLSQDNIKAVQESDIVILALKPYTILKTIDEVHSYLDPKRHILVSTATGVSLADIQQTIKTPVPVFRAMPNTGADVGMSVTCICTTNKDKETIDTVKYYFDTFGETIQINEELMNSATVLGACGIAYALKFIRAMIQGGIEIGFDVKTATNIATHTVKGATELLIQKNTHPESEIDKVTTPKGCTIAGLNEMEHNGFSSALIKGIKTSFENI